MRKLWLISLVLLMAACEIIPESDADEEERETREWWDNYYGREHSQHEGNNFGW